MERSFVFDATVTQFPSRKIHTHTILPNWRPAHALAATPRPKKTHRVSAEVCRAVALQRSAQRASCVRLRMINKTCSIMEGFLA